MRATWPESTLCANVTNGRQCQRMTRPGTFRLRDGQNRVRTSRFPNRAKSLCASGRQFVLLNWSSCFQRRCQHIPHPADIDDTKSLWTSIRQQYSSFTLQLHLYTTFTMSSHQGQDRQHEQFHANWLASQRDGPFNVGGLGGALGGANHGYRFGEFDQFNRSSMIFPRQSTFHARRTQWTTFCASSSKPTTIRFFVLGTRFTRTRSWRIMDEGGARVPQVRTRNFLSVSKSEFH